MLFLLAKTHNKTGLKYLCKHEGTRESCFKYCGSGVRWRNHLRKHGKDLTTEVLIETDNPIELRKFGIAYSRLWNVVSDSKWANLCEENGYGGLAGFRFSEESKQKIGLIHKGRKLTEAHKHKIGQSKSGSKNQWYGTKGPFNGKHHSLEVRKRISEAMKRIRSGK